MDNEDLMWKDVYEKMQKRQSELSIHHQPVNAHERQIQEIDGGFFERFGSLLREHSQIAQEQEQLDNLRAAEAAAQVFPGENDDNDDQVQLRKISTTSDTDTEPESTTSSDSEEARDTVEYFAVGWNIDELYSELLFEILHNVGCDVTYELGQTALFSYVQDAFKMANDKHHELLIAAEKKEPPEFLLNVEVIEGKDLVPKDSNGLSDPFVTLYLASNTSTRYNTSVKSETLNPLWEEHFALPISDKTAEDALCLEVWDFDPAETVREKFGKFFQVKGVRGVRKLMKEIAVTATTGQHENELIGTAKIPLKNIPASGMTMWYSLDKKNKTNRQGIVKIHLTFGSEKNTQVSAQEHRHLLRIMLLHELETTKAKPYCWIGNYSPQAEALIVQHGIQSGLSTTDLSLAQWTVYATANRDLPLNFSLFSKLLDKLIKPIKTSAFCEEDTKQFWDAVKRLLPSCFGIIRKIRKKQTNAKAAMKQLLEVLKILSKLQALGPPESLDLFPSNLHPWLPKSDEEEQPKFDIESVLNFAVIQGSTDWFNYIVENNQPQDNTDDGKLLYLIQIIQLVRADLQKAVEFYDKMFQEVIGFPYAKVLYTLYQVKISAIAEPEVITICKSLKRISYDWNCIAQSSEEPLDVGTKLFELYLALKRFLLLGKGLCPEDYDTFDIQNYHKWFHAGVAQWLDIAVFRALQRIEKAVKLDNLAPVDETVKYSSSALDTLTIFHQIKIFWEQLNWPDVEGSYTFIAKIIDDICRCCVFYADRMSARVAGMGVIQNVYETKFEVTSEWCLAINNIDYVRLCLDPFAEELGTEDILQQLSDLRSPLEADRCRKTLQIVIENSVDTVRNKIIELLETVATKMTPAMKRLLVEGAELLHQDSNSIDRVMMYLDNNLATLHDELNEDNFNRILEIIWEHLGQILNDLIQTNIEKRRPPSFFANLRATLELMVKCFKQSDDETNDCSALKRIERLLKVNGMETAELIHLVHQERQVEQTNLTESPYGELTVRLQFLGNDLKVEVMNARNLMAMDSNGSCDSFVRMYVLPDEKFTTATKPKTQTHSKNQFPLFDETFIINLTPEQRRVPDALVLFSVKDKDFLGMSNQLIGEAFVCFSDIPSTSQPISSLPQVHLFLHRPSRLNTDPIKALENRQGDKLAKEFVKKLKQKMNP